MEDGLVPKKFNNLKIKTSLNPYCSGRWSRTGRYAIDYDGDVAVLILIVVEDGLVHHDYQALSDYVMS